MVSEIFASDTLFSLLAIVYSAPGRRYYVNELIKLSGRFPRSVQLALSKLERSELVSTERQANLKYYWANDQHPVFEEIRSLLEKTAGPEMTIRNQVLSLGSGVKAAFLYGDPVESLTSDGPNLDLIVIGDVESSALRARLNVAEGQLGRSINCTLIPPAEWDKQVLRKGSLGSWLYQQPRRLIVGSEETLKQTPKTEPEDDGAPAPRKGARELVSLGQPRKLRSSG